jgi:aminopeptidase N
MLVTAALVTIAPSGTAATRADGTPPAGPPGSLDPPDPYFPGLGNRGYDVEHYDLGIAYDPASGDSSGAKAGALRGDTRIKATATEDLPRFNLDLAGLDVASVRVDGRAARFSRTAHELRVRPRTPIAEGAPFTVRVRYSGVPLPDTIPGLGVQNGWLVTNDGATTLNEPDGARYWFPGNDHPSDKATFRFRIDVPTPLVAVANGVLESKVATGDRTIWSWDETAPMTTYLSQIAIGNLELRDEAPVDGVAIRNAFAPGIASRAAGAAEETPDMLRFLSGWFGEFPFSTYGIMVPAGGPIGLAFEAQTFSIISQDLFDDPDFASAILAHELSHQWFGDSVSPATWDETWLNEGFATYGEWLWADHALDDPLQDAVDRAIRVVNRSPDVATDDPGINAMFGLTTYERGGLTLHALRLTVGDEAFARILRTYAERFGGKTATTEDFIGIANEVTGQDLTSFFRSWLGPGPLPELPTTVAPVGSDPPTTIAVAKQ